MDTNVGPGSEAGQDPSPPTRRVVAVVELLAAGAKSPRTLAEICRELGISRSTGHSILTSLCASDWVARDPLSGKYTIGLGLPRVSIPNESASRVLHQPLRRLCAAIDMPASVAEVRNDLIAVIDADAPGAGGPRVRAGQRLPFVAPFGREFVAWSSPTAQKEWLNAGGPANDAYRRRMPKILRQIRARGYGLERLSDPLVRVHSALLALMEGGDALNPVSARLAGAVADLTIVDFLPAELDSIEEQALATISAPIFGAHGEVVMTVSAQPYRKLSLKQVQSVAAEIIDFAQHARRLMVRADS